MATPSALQSMKLRKSSVPAHDASAPRFDSTVIENTTESYNTTVRSCNFENWGPALGEHTFRTVTLTLTVENARVLVEGYRAYEAAGRDVDAPAVTEAVDVLERELGPRLEKLIHEIQAAHSSTAGVFMKMSSRSAKDSALAPARLRLLYRAALEKTREPGDTSPPDENTRITALLTASRALLCYPTPRAALHSFVVSERIFQDMLLALKYPDPAQWDTRILVREWADIDPDMEFRGFVRKGELNALCQYNYNMFSPRLLDQKDSIADRIRIFYTEKIRPKIESALPDCIVDFAIADTGKIYVIELNPFLSTTDGALFSWERERDVLEEGPFELRVVQKARTGASVLFPREWRSVMEETM
ncbi:D123-domain-containing protein [Fimicolochytrium jonesii]|uniref:D123-domain-containing protein n=1 Tax=Fimicolochytrium jonesii TaxID=1396493 RepID=UPI0022FE29E0|nr:D123-domain-containing protein [Fimicolochytrium jonesii]KAI8821502.1 D123-domain-containing protein [Fimicolochytrium jonesii]